MARMAIRIFIVAAVVYLALLVLVYLFQPRLVFLPGIEGRTGRTPADLGLEYKSVSLKTPDGETLSAWWVPARNAIASIHFSHGNAGDISGRLESIALLNRLGLNVLIYDYRGYGGSSGRPSENGTYVDARAAWDWLVDSTGIPAGEIFLLGRSLGAGVAAGLAERLPEEARPAGLILESAFTSVPDMAREIHPWLPWRHVSRIRYDTLRRLAGDGPPVLVVHSRDDEIVPFPHAERLVEAAGSRARLLEISGDHNGGFLQSRVVYERGLNAFIRTTLAPGRKGR
ncbi:MAG: alpha/beta hydrolase [Wenzhouxiangellaceae bacterium]|nr:alpha/beta hydrolase [Wenzhouxiangellaceae bacterium]